MLRATCWVRRAKCGATTNAKLYMTMLKRVLGLLGWLGVALVFSALAIRILRPEWVWYSRPGHRRPGLHAALHPEPVARDRAGDAGARGRFGSLAVASILVVLAILVAINYLSARHNKRWDLTSAKQFTLSEQTRKVLQSLEKPVSIKVFATSEELARFRERLDEFKYASSAGIHRVHRRGAAPVTRQSVQGRSAGHGRHGIRRARRAGRVGRRAGADQRLVKVIAGRQHKVYFVQGHGERDPDGSDRAGLQHDQNGPGLGQLHGRQADAGAAEGSAGRCVGADRGGTEDRLLPARDRDVEEVPRDAGARCCSCSIRRTAPNRRELTGLIALLHDWAIEIGSNVVVDVSGMGQLFGTGAAGAGCREIQPARDHRKLQADHGVSARPVGRTVTGNPERPLPADAGRNERRAAGPRPTSRS